MIKSVAPPQMRKRDVSSSRTHRLSALPPVPQVGLGILCLTLLAGLAIPLAAQPESRESALTAIRARATELEGSLADIRKRKQGLVGDLVEAEYELELQTLRVSEARQQLASAQAAHAEAEAERVVLEQRLADVRAAVTRRVAGLYRKTGQGAARLLLSVQATDDLLGALRSLRFMVRRDVDLRRDLNDAQDAMARQLEVLAQHRLEVETLVELESTRLAERQRLHRRRANLLAQLERSERTMAGEFDRLTERESKLVSLLTTLSDQGTAGLEGRRIQEYRGVLDRPMVGSVTRPFGPRRDPRYQTLVPHNGLRLTGLAGEPVRVIFPGTVLYAEELEGYGPTVIVLHRDRVFSLYAGLDGISVERDELVSIGQVLGSADGALYFEVRDENRPVNPAEWIR